MAHRPLQLLPSHRYAQAADSSCRRGHIVSPCALSPGCVPSPSPGSVFDPHHHLPASASASCERVPSLFPFPSLPVPFYLPYFLIWRFRGVWIFYVLETSWSNHCIVFDFACRQGDMRGGWRWRTQWVDWHASCSWPFDSYGSTGLRGGWERDRSWGWWGRDRLRGWQEWTGLHNWQGWMDRCWLLGSGAPSSWVPFDSFWTRFRGGHRRLGTIFLVKFPEGGLLVLEECGAAFVTFEVCHKAVHKAASCECSAEFRGTLGTLWHFVEGSLFWKPKCVMGDRVTIQKIGTYKMCVMCLHDSVHRPILQTFTNQDIQVSQGNGNTAGTGWCFPWKNPLRDMFLWFPKGFSHGNTKSVSERKIQVCFFQVFHR